MALLLPAITDNQNSPSHSFLHRVLAIDSDAVEQSFQYLPTGFVTTKAITGKGYSFNTVTKTTAYTATVADDHIVCNSTTAFTITLPAATGTGKKFMISNINIGTVTIDANGAETIDGDTTQLCYQWESIPVIDYAVGAWKVL
ncbi:MAG: hypothetical protein RLY43_1078 [Bacteroidota bacterium]|jgi:hypothetical protein